ncbi:MAG TPA: globin [Tepidisphaeraceae bacterium]|nr:globin [Tepidisphaeraceae bacterium]
MPLSEQDVYLAIGEAGFATLTAAFFRRVASDPLLSAIYPKHDLTGAEQRLCSFLTYRFGGPDSYVQARGHPRLRMRHAAFAIDRAAADRWVQVMQEALTDAAFPPEPAQLLRRYFSESANFLINRADGTQ